MEQFTVVLDQLIGFAIMLVIGYICVRCKVYGEKTLDGHLPADPQGGHTADGVLQRHGGRHARRPVRIRHHPGVPGRHVRAAHLVHLADRQGHCACRWTAATYSRRRSSSATSGSSDCRCSSPCSRSAGALFYSLMALLDQFLMWTYGVWLTRSEQTRRERPAASLAQQLRGLLSPGLVSVIVSLLVILIGHSDPRRHQHAAAHGRLDLHAAIADVHRRGCSRCATGRPRSSSPRCMSALWSRC